MRTASLTRRLIAGVLIAELLCAAILAFVAIGHEMHGRRRAFDVMLRGRGDSLMGAVQDAEDPEDNVTVDPTELTIPKSDLYMVTNPAGRILGHSPGSSQASLNALAAAHANGYYNFRADGQRYRAIRFEGMRVIDRDDHGGLRRPVTVFYASPTRDLWRGALEAVQFYVGASIVLIFFTAIVLIWYLRRRLSPLRDLATVAEKVSAQNWDFAPPEEALRTAELVPIAHSIDTLLKGLYQSFERQRRLTGDAAHELKTSIAVLKSSLQLLTMNHRSAEQYELGLEGLLSDTERMEDLATRMLALARLEEAPSYQDEVCDLASALQKTRDRLQPFASVRRTTLKTFHEGAAHVALPIEDAEVLCSNLLLNALQHSRPNGFVKATLYTDGQSVELLVDDNGDGIPADDLPYVFERFYRADRSRSRISGGAGLGLSICKAIAERAGGTIRVESTLGKGTRVTVHLPKASNEGEGSFIVSRMKSIRANSYLEGRS